MGSVLEKFPSQVFPKQRRFPLLAVGHTRPFTCWQVGGAPAPFLLG